MEVETRYVVCGVHAGAHSRPHNQQLPLPPCPRYESSSPRPALSSSPSSSTPPTAFFPPAAPAAVAATVLKMAIRPCFPAVFCACNDTHNPSSSHHDPSK